MDMAEQKKTTTCSSSLTAELATASHCSLSEYARVKGKGSVVHPNLHFSTTPTIFQSSQSLWFRR
jgi:hypothetical protein